MATYVPNAADTTQPTEDKFVYSAAEEFRKLKVRVAEVATAVGTGTGVTGGIPLANFVINQSTLNQRVEFASTNPLSWATGAGSITVRCEITFNNYFAANPGGHFAIVLRQDPALFASAVRGNGAAFGNLVTAPNGTQINPGAQIESWANGLSSNQGDNNLIPGAETIKPLQDGIKYLVSVESVISHSGSRLIRMAIHEPNNTGIEWGIVVDTGYVVDSNAYFDATKSAVFFGHVFPDNLSTWSIAVTNGSITWGPAPTDDASNIDRFSKFGGTIEGSTTITGHLTVLGGITGGSSGGLVEPITLLQPLTLAGTANSIKLNSQTGYFGNWGFVQNSVLNDNTTLMTKPNGTATASNFLSTNRSNLSGPFGYVATGMNADGNASTGTLGINGHATPSYSITVGGVNSITFASSGITTAAGIVSTNGMQAHSFVAGTYMKTPSLQLNYPAVSLGTQLTDMLTGPTSIGGTQAKALSNSAFDMEYAATIGNIRAMVIALGGDTENKIENSVRPLYAMMSCLLKALHDRNVI